MGEPEIDFIAAQDRCGQRNADAIADHMRRRGEAEGQFRLNRSTRYSAESEQGLTSTASAMTVPALANDLAVGTQKTAF